MAPDEYHFGDHMRIGLPLQFTILVAVLVLIPLTCYRTLLKKLGFC